MKKYIIPGLLLIAYILILLKIMVFKDVPLIRVGSIMLNFGGTNPGTAGNFIPFTTIIPYFFGYKGWMIAGINLIGNIALLVPIGILVPFLYENITWKKSLVLAFFSGLIIEVMQVMLHVGIFDIDDVILNALGVMIGYGIYIVLARWIRAKQYKYIIIAGIITSILAVWFYIGVVYPMTHQTINHEIASGINEEDIMVLNIDPCRGTGGNGEIIRKDDNMFTMKRTDGDTQTINFTDDVVIRTASGDATIADVKIGDRITLVGDQNSDNTFRADFILVCASDANM